MTFWKLKLFPGKVSKSDTALCSNRFKNNDFTKSTNTNMNQSLSKNRNLDDTPEYGQSTTLEKKPKINFNDKVSVLQGGKDRRQYTVKLKSSADSLVKEPRRKKKSKSPSRHSDHSGPKIFKNMKKRYKKVKMKKAPKVSRANAMRMQRDNIFARRRMPPPPPTFPMDDIRNELEQIKNIYENKELFHPQFLKLLDTYVDKPVKQRTVFPPVTLSKKGKKFLEGRAKRLNRHTDILTKIKTRSLLKSLPYRPFEFNGLNVDDEEQEKEEDFDSSEGYSQATYPYDYNTYFQNLQYYYPQMFYGYSDWNGYNGYTNQPCPSEHYS